MASKLTSEQPPTDDRRTADRFPYSMEVILQELSGESRTTPAGPPIFAHIYNVSQRGMCVSSSVPLIYSKVVRCDIGLKDLPVAVPTVAQVRWVEKINLRNYRCGLRYLFDSPLPS